MKSLYCLVILLVLLSTTIGTNLEDKDESEHKSRYNILSEEELKRLEDPNCPEEESSRLMKKYQEGLEKMMKEIKESFDEVKSLHPHVELSDFGIDDYMLDRYDKTDL